MPRVLSRDLDELLAIVPEQEAHPELPVPAPASNVPSFTSFRPIEESDFFRSPAVRRQPRSGRACEPTERCDLCGEETRRSLLRLFSAGPRIISICPRCIEQRVVHCDQCGSPFISDGHTRCTSCREAESALGRLQRIGTQEGRPLPHWGDASPAYEFAQQERSRLNENIRSLGSHSHAIYASDLFAFIRATESAPQNISIDRETLGVPLTELPASYEIVQTREGNVIRLHRLSTRNSGFITNHSYKPQPIFHQMPDELESDRHFGLELEVEYRDDETHQLRFSRDDFCRKLIDVLGDGERLFYTKYDGSVSGFELVTHPATLAFYKNEHSLRHACQVMRYVGGRSAQAQSCHCGLHIHIGKNTIPERKWPILSYFVYSHQAHLELIARRNNSSFAEFRNPDGSWDDLSRSNVEIEDDRYCAINFYNLSTIEFRLFKGTLKYDEILASIQVVDLMTSYASQSSRRNVENRRDASWHNLVDLALASPEKYREFLLYICRLSSNNEYILGGYDVHYLTEATGNLAAIA